MDLERRTLLGAALAVGAAPVAASPVTQLSILSTRWIPMPTGVDLSNHHPVGALLLEVSNFDAKKPKRRITIHGVDAAKEDISGSGKGQPQPPRTGRKSRWHMDADSLFSSVKRPEKMLVKILLSDTDLKFNLDVPDGIPVALADSSAPGAFANPSVKPGGRAVTFWVLRNADQTTPKEIDTGINIAVLVQDKDVGGADFELPIIIDPMVRNRG